MNSAYRIPVRTTCCTSCGRQSSRRLGMSSARLRRTVSDAAKCFTLGMFKPFATEFEDMLSLYPDGDAERQKDLAESIKSMMSTFSMIGSLLLGAVWGVNGPDIEVLADDSVWGSSTAIGHGIYKALTICAAFMCILLVGTTARTSFLLDLIPYGGHKTAIKAWGHVYIVVLPYLMFAIIVALMFACVTIQATLTSSRFVGCAIGIFVAGLGFIFTVSWIRADRVLGTTLTSMVDTQPHNAGDKASPSAVTIQPNTAGNDTLPLS